jgi:hypothetical protein
MNTIEVIALLAVLALIVFYLIYWLRSQRPKKSPALSVPLPEVSGVNQSTTLPLRLQAYERLIILAERLALPHLISRIPAGDAKAAQYLQLLTEQIRQEYDYNLSQQLYVEPAVWDAITNLKEQNIYILHQLAQTLSPEAFGTELAKRVLELLSQDPNASLHPIVLEAIRFEARKLM